MLTGIDALVRLSVTSYSLAMELMAGARMDEANGVMKVMRERRPTMSHLRELVKLSGISGSCWLSQPTTPLSRSITGRTGGGRLSLGFDARADSLVRILRCVWVLWLALV